MANETNVVDKFVAEMESEYFTNEASLSKDDRDRSTSPKVVIDPDSPTARSSRHFKRDAIQYSTSSEPVLDAGDTERNMATDNPRITRSRTKPKSDVDNPSSYFPSSPPVPDTSLPVKPRGRGRPPLTASQKARRTAVDNRKKRGNLSSALTKHNIAKKNQPLKGFSKNGKRLGRPSKEVTKTLKSNKTDSKKGQALHVRRSGRPRKEVSSEAMHESERKKELAEPVKRRGRGRPRKGASTEPADDNDHNPQIVGRYSLECSAITDKWSEVNGKQSLTIWSAPGNSSGYLGSIDLGYVDGAVFIAGSANVVDTLYEKHSRKPDDDVPWAESGKGMDAEGSESADSEEYSLKLKMRWDMWNKVNGVTSTGGGLLEFDASGSKMQGFIMFQTDQVQEWYRIEGSKIANLEARISKSFMAFVEPTLPTTRTLRPR